MTISEVKRALMAAEKAKFQLELLYARRQQIQDLANRITPLYNSSPGGSGTQDKIGAAIAGLADIEAEIGDKANELVRQYAEARDLIDRLPAGACKEILIRRYLLSQKWWFIADEMHYGWAHIHRLHVQGLAELASRIKDDTQ